jgi:hypothetical protein
MNFTTFHLQSGRFLGVSDCLSSGNSYARTKE